MTRMVVDISSAPAMFQATIATRAHGVVVSHPLRMRKALGSNPSVSGELQCAEETPQSPVTKHPLLTAVPSHRHWLASDIQR